MQINWRNYEFTIYPMDATWNDVGGIYIFSGQGQDGLWRPLYIGQTNSFKTRLPNHDRWAEAQRLGATHVHARKEEQEATRLAREAELIQAFQPRLNTLLR